MISNFVMNFVIKHRLLINILIQSYTEYYQQSGFVIFGHVVELEIPL